MVWVDDFSTDHFADAYTLLAAFGAVQPTVGGGVASADGVVAWNDQRAPTVVIEAHLQMLASPEPLILAMGLANATTAVGALVEMGAGLGGEMAITASGSPTAAATPFVWPPGDWTLHFKLDSAGLMSVDDGAGQAVSLALDATQIASLVSEPIWPTVIMEGGTPSGGSPLLMTLWSYDTDSTTPVAPVVEIAGRLTVDSTAQGVVRVGHRGAA